MKIEYRNGDVLASDVYVVAHGCNNKGVMGSGIAAQIKNQYPIVYERYNKIYNDIGLEMGSYHPVVASENRMILNMITQGLYEKPINENEPKRFASYDAIASCMTKANKNLSYYDFDEIAMPQIGAGLGGGNWDIIEAIIEACCTDIKPIVYIFK